MAQLLISNFKSLGMVIIEEDSGNLGNSPELERTSLQSHG